MDDDSDVCVCIAFTTQVYIDIRSDVIDVKECLNNFVLHVKQHFVHQ